MSKAHRRNPAMSVPMETGQSPYSTDLKTQCTPCIILLCLLVKAGAHEPLKEHLTGFDFTAVQLLPYEDVGNTLHGCVAYQKVLIQQVYKIKGSSVLYCIVGRSSAFGSSYAPG